LHDVIIQTANVRQIIYVMSNQQEPENLPFDNEHSLQTLVRTITLSQGEFSLIFLRCNYADLRQRMVERLHQISPVHIREITLPASVKTLYTNIREQLGDEQPPVQILAEIPNRHLRKLMHDPSPNLSPLASACRQTSGERL
jgi:hypothetical protein